MASVPVRFALALISLAAVAWMALSIRSLDLDAEGRAIARSVDNGKISAQDLQRGRDAFQAARRFNPDITPRMHEAFMLTAVGRNREALALTKGIVKDEPDNRDGWAFVFLAARSVGDRATAARAAREVRALDPRNAQTILSRLSGD